jgi:hypothetical protein
MSDKIIWSGKTSSFHHKWNDTPNPPDVKSGFRKVWFLDAQWSDCPIEVYDEVKKLWQAWELGNDNYIIKTDMATLTEEIEHTEAIRQYILEKEPEIGYEDKILIHWWW